MCLPLRALPYQPNPPHTSVIISASLQGADGFVSNCARYPNSQSIFQGSLVDPRLRASNEHILIVRVPRAGGRPGYPITPTSSVIDAPRRTRP
jgi:hypothetical protein